MILYQSNVPAVHAGNPLIEALPPIAERLEVAMQLSRGPLIPVQQCMQDSLKFRVYNVDGLDQIYLASPPVVDVAEAFDRALRRGYLTRNPATRDGEHYRYQRLEIAWLPLQGVEALGCLFVEAESGIGKTTMVNRILAQYPQVIRHDGYKGVEFKQAQIVWVSVRAPRGGSTIQLMANILEAIDMALGQANTSRAIKRKDGRDALSALEQAVRTYYVGAIHIDDAQRFCSNTLGADEMRGFLVALSEAVKVPIFMTGTPAATKFFGGSFETARRACHLGAFHLDRALSHEDKVFNAMVTFLLKYQLVDIPLALDADGEVLKKLYDFSMGVTSVLKKLHLDAQKIALSAKGAREGDVALRLSHYAAAAKPLRVLARKLGELNPRMTVAEQLAAAVAEGADT